MAGRELWPARGRRQHATIIYFFYFLKIFKWIDMWGLVQLSNFFCYTSAGRWVEPVNFRVNSGLIQNLCILRTINKNVMVF
jgi:hypothetical protein